MPPRDAVSAGPLARRLTLSVVSHGHEPLLQRVLADLSSSEELRGVRIVVTLNRADEAFEPPDSPLEILVRRNAKPQGFGANHDQAFVDCDTPWFAILNPDLRIPDSACFAHLIKAAEAQPDMALVAPKIVNSRGDPEDALRSNLTPTSILRRRLRRTDPAPEADVPARLGSPFYWLAGMFMLVRSDAFRAVGGFDQRYFLYCEDYDLCARLFLAGYALQPCPSVSVIHDAQRDSHRSGRHLRLHLSSLFKAWTSAAYWGVCRHEWRRATGRTAQANSGTNPRR